MPHANGKSPNSDQPQKDLNLPQYRQKLKSYAPGRWFQFPREYLWAMTRDQAIALSALIDKADRCKSLLRNNGWFYYTIDRMEWDTNMDRNVQLRVINSLIELGYVRRETRGMPPKRFLFINIDKVERDVIKVVQKRDLLTRKRSRTSRRTLIRKIEDGLLNGDEM